ncbi:MAG: hypothetical protein AB1585_05330 [Thermodesulfobacteriota bacterium]
MSLLIDANDIVRATLDTDSGNVGYIGISPDGTRYHVVVPVDLQIARGIKAGNRPSDSTPFGGYKGWHYFCCPGYSLADKYNGAVIPSARQEQARVNGQVLIKWAKEEIGLEITITKVVS